MGSLGVNPRRTAHNKGQPRTCGHAFALQVPKWPGKAGRKFALRFELAQKQIASFDRDLFAGSRRVLITYCARKFRGAIAPHSISVLVFRPCLSRPLQAGPTLGGMGYKKWPLPAKDWRVFLGGAKSNSPLPKEIN